MLVFKGVQPNGKPILSDHQTRWQRTFAPWVHGPTQVVSKQGIFEPCCNLSCIVSWFEVTFKQGFEGFSWKTIGDALKNDTPKTYCRYYRTWKTIRDALIYPKHTTFTINIHHASFRKEWWLRLVRCYVFNVIILILYVYLYICIFICLSLLYLNYYRHQEAQIRY